MNKYLLLSAAAVLVNASAATAANAKGGSIDLGNGCGLDINEVQKGVYVVRYGGCGEEGVDTGMGLSRKTALENRLTCRTIISAMLAVSPLATISPFRSRTAGPGRRGSSLAAPRRSSRIREPTPWVPLQKQAATSWPEQGRSSQN